MDIKAKGTKVWRKDFENERGSYSLYSVGVSNKKDDGTYTTMYMPIRFARRANAPEKIPNGAKCDFEGFLSVDEYKDEKRLIIIATKVEVEGGDLPDSFVQAAEDIPF